MIAPVTMEKPSASNATKNNAMNPFCFFMEWLTLVILYR
jgi:hypothetical protein